MRTILPGQPQPKRQALTTAYWDGLRVVAYISGNTAIILNGPHTILQTIYIDQVETLTAVTIEEISGRIAICDDNTIYIYRPVGRDEGILKWLLAHELRPSHENPQISSLSWGSAEECLVAGSGLSLWYIPENESPRIIWESALAFPLELAYFSYDGGLVASCGQHDRMVKIWRRLSYEVDSSRFDVSYLPHPSAVVDLHWRRPWHAEQNADNLLYTFCSDNHVRVWSYSDPHSLSVMELVASIDLTVSIQPRRLSVGSISDKRYAFVIDSRDFSDATEKAVSGATNSGTNHALEHLIQIANRSPEIIVVLDGLGHMCVWGLENSGVKGKKSMVEFNIVFVDAMNILIPKSKDPQEDYARFCVFAGGETLSSLSLLVQSYTGTVDWYDSPITKFFDTSPREDRVVLRSSLSGHDSTIDRIVRSWDGNTILSWTDDNDIIVWKYRVKGWNGLLVRHNAFHIQGEIVDALLLGDGGTVLFLQEDQLQLWDISFGPPRELASIDLSAENDPMSLTQISPSAKATRHSIAILYVDSTMEYWEVGSPDDAAGKRGQLVQIGSSKTDLRNTVLSESGAEFVNHLQNSEITRTQLPESGPVAVSKEGNLRIVQLSRRSDMSQVRSKADRTVETSVVRPSIVVSSGQGKVAMADSSGTAISIWDTTTAIWEFFHQFVGNGAIETLSWACLSGGTLILAVCFPFHITILAPRISSEQRSDGLWYHMCEYRTRDFSTHVVGDLCWLNSGDVLVGTGNQLFVLDPPASQTNGNTNGVIIEESVLESHPLKQVQTKNADQPVFHPDFVDICVLMGHIFVAKQTLRSLQKQLKFFAEGDVVSNTLHWPSYIFLSEFRDRSKQRIYNDSTNGSLDDEDEDEEFNSDLVTKLQANLDAHQLSQLTPNASENLKITASKILDLSAFEKSVDEYALRYIHLLYTAGSEAVGWDAIMFASISTSQEVLVDVVTQYFGGKLDWSAARKSGLFLWLSDREALRTHMENVARSEYTKNEDKNPVDCSLYYLALNKKNILQGLWRMTVGVREKENTMKLLANNFNEPRWKATALKNAYALFSKRRFEYAAAFFLLGNSLKDAVNVCIHQINDLQLAIAIARVYEHDDGTVLNSILNDKILPQTVLSPQARWMAAWAYKTMDKSEEAIQVLVRPIHAVIGRSLNDLLTEVSPSTSEMSIPRPPPACLNIQANDPVLTVLYRHLRSQFVTKNKWTTSIVKPKEEYDFVIKSALALKRRGLTFLSLALLSNWEFIPYSYSTKSDLQDRRVSRASFSQQQKINPLGRRMSFNLAAFDAGRTDHRIEDGPEDDKSNQKRDLEDQKVKSQDVDGGGEKTSKVEEQPKTSLKPKPPPTQFVEPSASSLLDSFGF